jgi:hypothetical protein
VATPIPCGWRRNNLMETCKLGVKTPWFPATSRNHSK